MPSKNSIDNKYELKVVLVVWDECLHMPLKKLEESTNQFKKSFFNAFKHEPEFALPFIHLSTSSIMFPSLSFFKHDSKYVEYKGVNKDLAIVKYCSGGLEDMTGKKHHIISDTLNNPDFDEKKLWENIPAPVNWAIFFITSDKGRGMQSALKALPQNKSICFFAHLEIPQEYSTSQHKNKFAGDRAGVSFNSVYNGSTESSWLIELA